MSLFKKKKKEREEKNRDANEQKHKEEMKQVLEFEIAAVQKKLSDLLETRSMYS